MSITERRIDRLVNPDANEDLPPFLTSKAGHLVRIHDAAGDGGRAAERSKECWPIRRASTMFRRMAAKKITFRWA